MLFSFGTVAAAALVASVVRADTTTCSNTQACPEDLPCCSQYGECGTGSFCLGGCDPRFSYSLDSCAPAPICVDKTLTMDSLDRVVSDTKYLGNASAADWVSSGQPLAYDGTILLTMPANSGGSVLASTTYLWYGNVTARLKTGPGAGVVTAFILMSDVKDEIDFEYIGNQDTIAQTNYFWQGNPNPDLDNWANITVNDTQNDFHDYEVRWTPDELIFLVDGVAGETRKRTDRWNSTSQGWDFPQTPARIELSIWPGGASSNAEGTIEWAGGAIDWDSDQIQKYGYDYAVVDSVSISCYRADSGPGAGYGKGTSYTYSDSAGTNASVVVGDKSTILASFEATGTDMGAGNTTSNSSSSDSSVPTGSSGSTPATGSNSGSDSGSSGSSSSGSSTSGDSCTAAGFVQSCSSTTAASSSTKSAAARLVGSDRIQLLATTALGAAVAFVAITLL